MPHRPPPLSPALAPVPTDATASRVSAAEVVRNFAAVRRRAALAPVHITSHGRDSHVLCSAEQFRALGSRRESGGDEAVRLDLVQLAAWIDQGLLLIDRSGRILHANGALLAIVRCDPERLAGAPLFETFPEFAGTLAEPYLRRAMTLNEAALFEMPSPFQAGSWLRCRLAPVGEAIAALLRDITPEVRQLRTPDAHDEVLRAMAFNEETAFVRLSLRAYIERASPGLAAMLGLSEDRLIGVHFCNLFGFRQREMVSDAL
jgi:PAS domain-containing protein